MDSRTQNAKILLVVGLILIVGGIIGMMYQWSVYSEYAGQKPVYASQNGHITGASGAFARGLVAWNESPQAKADQAMNMFIFMATICALGAACLYYGLRRPPENAESESPEDMRQHAVVIPSHWDKEPLRSGKRPPIPYFWEEEETQAPRHRRQPSSPSYWEDDGRSRIQRAEPPAYWDEDERIKSQNPNYSRTSSAWDGDDRPRR